MTRLPDVNKTSFLINLKAKSPSPYHVNTLEHRKYTQPKIHTQETFSLPTLYDYEIPMKCSYT